MILDFLLNLNFWSAVCGLMGTVLVFFFGLPSAINKNGHINLILEQSAENEVKKYKAYKILSYLGLSLIAISFLIQIIHIFV